VIALGGGRAGGGACGSISGVGCGSVFTWRCTFIYININSHARLNTSLFIHKTLTANICTVMQ